MKSSSIASPSQRKGSRHSTTGGGGGHPLGVPLAPGSGRTRATHSSFSSVFVEEPPAQGADDSVWLCSGLPCFRTSWSVSPRTRAFFSVLVFALVIGCAALSVVGLLKESEYQHWLNHQSQLTQYVDSAVATELRFERLLVSVASQSRPVELFQTIQMQLDSFYESLNRTQRLLASVSYGALSPRCAFETAEIVTHWGALEVQRNMLLSSLSAQGAFSSELSVNLSVSPIAEQYRVYGSAFVGLYVDQKNYINGIFGRPPSGLFCAEEMEAQDRFRKTLWAALLCGQIVLFFVAIVWQLTSGCDQGAAQELLVQKAVLDHVLPESLSSKLAAALKSGVSISASTLQLARYHPMASVMFADLVEFTPIAARLPAPTLIALLNVLFTQYDRQAAHHGVTKIKTIGDCYMAATGLTESDHDAEPNAESIFQFAQSLILATARLVEQYQSLNPPPALTSHISSPHHQNTTLDTTDPSEIHDDGGLLEMQRRHSIEAQLINQRHFPDLSLRIGIHSGPLVSGIVGVSLFSFDVWGDTVNVAARMEATGAANHIHCSTATKALLGPQYSFQRRPMTLVKGKGPMVTFLYCVGISEQCDRVSTAGHPCLSRANNLSSTSYLTQVDTISVPRAVTVATVGSPTIPGTLNPVLNALRIRPTSAAPPKVAMLRRIASSAYFEDHLQTFFNPTSPTKDLAFDSVFSQLNAVPPAIAASSCSTGSSNSGSSASAVGLPAPPASSSAPRIPSSHFYAHHRPTGSHGTGQYVPPERSKNPLQSRPNKGCGVCGAGCGAGGGGGLRPPGKQTSSSMGSRSTTGQAGPLEDEHTADDAVAMAMAMGELDDPNAIVAETSSQKSGSVRSEVAAPLEMSGFLVPPPPAGPGSPQSGILARVATNPVFGAASSRNVSMSSISSPNRSGGKINSPPTGPTSHPTYCLTSPNRRLRHNNSYSVPTSSTAASASGETHGAAPLCTTASSAVNVVGSPFDLAVHTPSHHPPQSPGSTKTPRTSGLSSGTHRNSCPPFPSPTTAQGSATFADNQGPGGQVQPQGVGRRPLSLGGGPPLAPAAPRNLESPVRNSKDNVDSVPARNLTFEARTQDTIGSGGENGHDIASRSGSGIISTPTTFAHPTVSSIVNVASPHGAPFSSPSSGGHLSASLISGSVSRQLSSSSTSASQVLGSGPAASMCSTSLTAHPTLDSPSQSSPPQLDPNNLLHRRVLEKSLSGRSIGGRTASPAMAGAHSTMVPPPPLQLGQRRKPHSASRDAFTDSPGSSVADTND